MVNEDPVSLWIEQLRASDEVAARRVWEHFAARLYLMARRKLRPETRRVYDEEDAALSMFESVCSGMAAGRFPDLQNRDSLWRLMLVITSQKISNRHRFDQQKCRDIRRNLADSIFSSSEGSEMPLISREPTPEFTAELEDTFERLFSCLDEPNLREIATLRMEGYTDEEIAQKLNCSRRTVQRRITIVRRHWERSENPVD